MDFGVSGGPGPNAPQVSGDSCASTLMLQRSQQDRPRAARAARESSRHLPLAV
jgi:hypothetical protein